LTRRGNGIIQEKRGALNIVLAKEAVTALLLTGCNQSIQARNGEIASTNVRLHPYPADLPPVTKPTFYEIVRVSKNFLDSFPPILDSERIVVGWFANHRLPEV